MAAWFLYNENKKQRRRKQRCQSPKVCSLPFPLEEPEGQVPLKSNFYIERPPIESDGYAAIQRPNALIRIKAPRQMGKSSLMTRILDQAQCHQAQIVELNLQTIDEAVVKDLDRLLQWLTGRVAKALQCPFNPAEDWDSELYGSKTSCHDYFEQQILPQITPPFLVIALDEVDRVFQYESVAKDFLGLIRAWHEFGKNKPLWQKLQFILVHSQEVYIPLDINESPFNVGTAIQLPFFDFKQSQNLMQRHGLNWSEQQLRQFRQWVGGHPYLLRVGFYEVAKGHFTLETLLKNADSTQGAYEEHLRRLLHHLQDSGLAPAMKQIVKSAHSIRIDSQIAFKLRSLGLIRLVNQNEVEPAFQLYRQYFSETL